MSLRKDQPIAAVVENLRVMFADKVESTKRSVEEIYKAAHPGSFTAKQNKTWLEGRMTNIRRYGLAVTIKSPVTGRVEYVQLTPDGKKALLAPSQGPQPATAASKAELAKAGSVVASKMVGDDLSFNVTVPANLPPKGKVQISIVYEEGTVSAL